MRASIRSGSRIAAGGPSLAFSALLLGNVALATGGWFVRLSDTGPIATAFWRLFLALPLLFLLSWRGPSFSLAGQKRVIGLIILGGALFAADLASWHLGILRTNLANATLLGNSTSLFLPLTAIFVTGIWPGRVQWFALAIALGGGVLLVGGSGGAERGTIVGDLLCIAAGMFYVAFLLTMQSVRRVVPSWWLLALSSAASAPLALLMAMATGEQIWPTDWTPVICVAIISQVIGQGLLIYALAHFSPLIIGLALLVQPVIAAMIGWIAFGETLSSMDFAGATIIGVALVLVRLPAGGTQAKGVGTSS